ncbi:MAG: hypothetical protein U5K51_14615 [Flavobacteriaceae bacterium]|nr:hypothetical protein [Flavobacteriaceae bacterium]
MPHTPLFEGAYIYHDTAKIKKLRKNIVELVLSDYPSAKVFPETGKKHTPFQTTIAQIGIPNVRYPKGMDHLQIEKDLSHPDIKSDLSAMHQLLSLHQGLRRDTGRTRSWHGRQRF